MSLKIEQATPEHAPAIAKIFLATDTDPFLALQLGTVSPDVLRAGLTERLAESIAASGQVYVIARGDDAEGEGEVVSYASWTLPRGKGEPWVRMSEEEKAAATEAYRAKLLDGMNAALVMDFREEISALRERVLGERRHYMLGNLGTLPAARGKGAGTALTSWPFERADREGVAVYLDTDESGSARRIYDRLGFVRVGEAVFDLAEYGGSGVHTHIGMIREPQRSG